MERTAVALALHHLAAAADPSCRLARHRRCVLAHPSFPLSACAPSHRHCLRPPYAPSLTERFFLPRPVPYPLLVVAPLILSASSLHSPGTLPFLSLSLSPFSPFTLPLRPVASSPSSSPGAPTPFRPSPPFRLTDTCFPFARNTFALSVSSCNAAVRPLSRDGPGREEVDLQREVDLRSNPASSARRPVAHDELLLGAAPARLDRRLSRSAAHARETLSSGRACRGGGRMRASGEWGGGARRRGWRRVVLRALLRLRGERQF